MNAISWYVSVLDRTRHFLHTAHTNTDRNLYNEEPIISLPCYLSADARHHLYGWTAGSDDDLSGKGSWLPTTLNGGSMFTRYCTIVRLSSGDFGMCVHTYVPMDRVYILSTQRWANCYCFASYCTLHTVSNKATPTAQLKDSIHMIYRVNAQPATSSMAQASYQFLCSIVYVIV